MHSFSTISLQLCFYVWGGALPCRALIAPTLAVPSGISAKLQTRGLRSWTTNSFGWLKSSAHQRSRRDEHARLFSIAPPLPPTEAFVTPPEEKGNPASASEGVAHATASAAPVVSSTRAGQTAQNGGVVGRTLRRVLSFLTVMTTWLLFRVFLKHLNKVTCHNRQALMDAVLDRGDQSLLTVSNHVCVYDDPGLWSVLLPFWRTGQKKMRWAMCTDDIYNADPRLRTIFDAGKTLPIKRSKGMEHPLFKAFFQKLEEGEWGHIFAEGAIRQPWRFSRGEPMLGEFKAGIGRLLLRSKRMPIVLPMYHIGMHQVAPESPVQKRGRGKLVKMLPNIGRKIRVYVGEPIDVRPIVEKCRAKIGDVRRLPWTTRSTKEEVDCHKEIAAFVREHVIKLEAVARKDYYGDDPSSPYYTAV